MDPGPKASKSLNFYIIIGCQLSDLLATIKLKTKYSYNNIPNYTDSTNSQVTFIRIIKQQPTKTIALSSEIPRIQSLLVPAVTMQF